MTDIGCVRVVSGLGDVAIYTNTGGENLPKIVAEAVYRSHRKWMGGRPGKLALDIALAFGKDCEIKPFNPGQVLYRPVIQLNLPTVKVTNMDGSDSAVGIRFSGDGNGHNTFHVNSLMQFRDVVTWADVEDDEEPEKEDGDEDDGEGDTSGTAESSVENETNDET